MSWRYQPPVLSPVTPGSLVGGIAAAAGFRGLQHQSVVGTLRQRFGASDALLTDSGTSALILAYRALVPPGGTIAYPGYGCIDLSAAAVRAGVRVRLYDLDPKTLSPDLDSVKHVIERGVDAIVVTHLYGYPADIVAVQDLAAMHGVPVIEDAAQGAGGTLRGARLGSLSDIAILSFGRGKGTTAGSGGAVLVRTPALCEWARQTRRGFGVAARGGHEVVALAAQWLLGDPLTYRLPASIPALRLGEMVYRPAREPRTMTAAAAAILLVALRLDEQEIRHRRARASDILSLVGETKRVLPICSVAGGASGFLRLAVLACSGTVPTNAALGAVRGYPMTLEEHPQLQPMLASKERSGKGAEMLRDRLFTLPTHSRVASSDLARLRDWLNAPA